MSDLSSEDLDRIEEGTSLLLAERVERTLKDISNLKMLIAAIVEDAGGEVVVSNSILIGANPGALVIEERPWDGTVAVRTR